MFYVYLFIQVPDSRNCVCQCSDAYRSLERAKKLLLGKEGYITKYPSTKPVYVCLKEV